MISNVMIMASNYTHLYTELTYKNDINVTVVFKGEKASAVFIDGFLLCMSLYAKPSGKITK